MPRLERCYSCSANLKPHAKCFKMANGTKQCESCRRRQNREAQALNNANNHAVGNDNIEEKKIKV